VAVAVVGELLVAGGELLQALHGDGQFTCNSIIFL